MHKPPMPSTPIRARQVGLALRQSRRVAGMAGEFVAGKLGVSVSKISRMESGQRPPKLEDVAGLLTLVRGHRRSSRESAEAVQRGVIRGNRLVAAP